jgi:hypothetical protein
MCRCGIPHRPDGQGGLVEWGPGGGS